IQACGAAATGGPTSNPSASATGGTVAIGPAEKATVSVAFRLPNMESQAPIWLASNLGYYQQEGLTVTIINTPDTVSAVTGGSATFGMDTPGTPASAIGKGVNLAIASGYFCTHGATIAVQKDISTPADLAGKEVILGGTPGSPDVDYRLKLLKDAGFDLTGVAFNPVTVPGGSDAWAQLFDADKVALTYFFARQRAEIVAHGGRVVLDDALHPGYDGVLFATKAFLTQNPNTAARFLRATMKGVDYYLDTANQATVLKDVQADGFKLVQAQIDTYVQGTQNFHGCAGLPLDQTLINQTLTDGKVSPIPGWSSLTDTTALVAAQAAMSDPQTP
ncbi:MAG: ABC transporter substrate-binding protein, partial [Candidatus Limnocylindrales bacterium]